MHTRLIIRVLLFLTLCFSLLLVISVKNYRSSRYKAFTRNKIITIEKAYGKEPSSNVKEWDLEGEESVFKEKVSRNRSLRGCPLNYLRPQQDKGVQWFKENFQQMSPYVEWKRIHKFIETSANTSTKASKQPPNGNNATKGPLGTKANRQFLDSLQQATEKVVIMTPISDSKKHLENYFKLLCSFTYPHHLISVLLGEDSSADGTIYEAQAHAERLRGCFRKVEVVHLMGRQMIPSGNPRHEHDYQLFRRSHLAKARNQLLMKGVADNHWVLWIDADVKYAPEDLIEHLLWSRKDIVTANCLYRSSEATTDVYDRNTWAETEASRHNLALKSSNFLMLEGYGATERKYLNDLKFSEEEGEEDYEESIDDGYEEDGEEKENSGGGDRKRLGDSEEAMEKRELVSVAKTSGLESSDSRAAEDTVKKFRGDNKMKIEAYAINRQKRKLMMIGKNKKLKKKEKRKKKKKKMNLLVKLDGVGATVLLVKADLHRKGLNFPPFIFQHHIETEGLAKMATSVYNTQPYGLPNVYVIHS